MTNKTKTYKEQEGEKRHGLSIERLTTLLEYNTETGAFRWKNPWHPNCNKDWFYGVRNIDGYYHFLIDKKLYLAHRIAWALSYLEWPKLLIDHINQNKSDNRLLNLREVDYSQNALNTSIPHRKSVSGILGVYWDRERNKWKSSIKIRDKIYDLGRFNSKEEAKLAYDFEKSKHV